MAFFVFRQKEQEAVRADNKEHTIALEFFKMKGTGMKFGWLNLIWFLTAFMTLCVTAPVAESKDRTHRMEDMVVSTSRTEVAMADAPQSISVISADEIMASPFERVEDILRFSAGIQVTQHYGQQTGGIAGHLSMRGTGRNRVLMMLDGVPLNDNFSNTIAWVAWGLIPRESIERIEILRGPSSASYGSEGLGGIVNIITKNPRETPETSARAIAGSASTYGVSGLHSRKGERFGFLLSGAYEDSRGFYMIDPDDIDDLTLRRYREIGKGFGKVTYSPDERTDMSLSALYYQHEMGKGREYFYDDLILDQYRLGMTHRGDISDWKAMVYLNRGDKTAYQDVGQQGGTVFVPDRDEKFPENIVWGAEIQNTLPLFDSTEITTGVAFKQVSMDYKENQLRNMDRDVQASGKQRFISPFAEWTGRFMNNRLIAHAGVRYDNVRNYDGKAKDSDPFRDRDPYDESYSSETWDNFSPKLGLVYHPDHLTTLRTSFVSGFRTPSLFELYKPHVRAGGRFLRRANPDLDPEKIRTWEAGAERVFFDNLWIRTTYYHSRVSDYIESTTIEVISVDPDVRDEQNQNKAKVEINGIETEFDYYIGRGLSTFFNYTYNLSKVTKDDENPDREGNYLTGDFRHKFRTGMAYQNPAIINASVFLRYDRTRYTDDLNTNKAPNSTTVDISLWRKVFDLATLRLTVENATNEKAYIEDGRIYYGSVQFNF